ncbi:MAG: tripartite tricarboxylate transporter substrate binding protein BugE, partial [Burkholderiales bacterium]
MSLGLSLIAFLPALSSAQAYPNRPIKWIIPFPPGGTTDIVGRAMTDVLGAQLGQPVVIENRCGAAGAIGADAIAKSAPDGYTIGMATVSTHGTNPTTNPKLPYSVERDFIAVTNLASVPHIIAVHPSFPAKNMEEFLKQVRGNPGKFSYASSGTGGIGHMFAELVKVSTKTFVLHIPYRGSGPALNDTVAGQVNMIFDNLPSTLPFVQSGRLVAIAVAAPNRVPMLRNVPTLGELGFKDANVMAWYGIVVPAKTPDDIVKRLHETSVKALADPKVQERFRGAGATPVGNSPAEFQKQILDEMGTWARVVKVQKIAV